MNAKKIGEEIATAVAVIVGLCLLVLMIAGTIKLVIWMFS